MAAKRSGRSKFRKLAVELMAPRICLAADLGIDLHNDLNPHDVNVDGRVGPRDALAVINVLNRGLAQGEVDSGSTTLLCDINDDGRVTTLDALSVINAVNDAASRPASNESEVTVGDDAGEVVDDGSASDDGSDVDSDDSIEVSADDPVVDGENESDDDGLIDEDPVVDLDDESTFEDNVAVDDDDPDVVDENSTEETTDEETTDEETTDEDTTDEDTTDEDTTDEGTTDEDTTDEDTGCHGERGDGVRGALRLGGLLHHHIENLFERADGNEDGSITEDEVPEFIWDKLQKINTDGDAAVTLAEVEAYEDSLVDRVFERIDANDDGSIAEDEVTSRLWNRIVEADTNADELISLEEFQAFHDLRSEEVANHHAQAQVRIAEVVNHVRQAIRGRIGRR